MNRRRTTRRTTYEKVYTRFGNLFFRCVKLPGATLAPRYHLPPGSLCVASGKRKGRKKRKRRRKRKKRGKREKRVERGNRPGPGPGPGLGPGPGPGSGDPEEEGEERDHEGKEDEGDEPEKEENKKPIHNSYSFVSL